MALGTILAACKLCLLALAMWWLGLKLVNRIGDPDNRQLLKNLFVLSFVLRLIWSLFLLKVMPLLVHNHQYLSLGFLNDDGIFYDQVGLAGLEAIKRGESPLGYYGDGKTAAIAYLLFVTLIYGIAGHELLALQIVNSWIGALIPVFGFLVAQMFMSTAHARLSALLMAWYPEQIMYAGSHQKDISIVLGFIVGLWLIHKIFHATSRRQMAWHIGMFLACTAFLTLSRFYYTPVLGFVFLLNARAEGRIRKVSIRQIIQSVLFLLLILVIMAALIVTVVPRGASMLQSPILAATSFYQIFTANSATSGSLYGLFRFPLNIIFFPLPVLGVLLNPFILWPFISPAAFYWVLFPTMTCWYIILPFVVYGFWASRKMGYGRMIFFAVTATMFILVVTGSGLNTAGRSKLPLQPYALMYAVLGFSAYARGSIWMKWMAGIYGAALVGITVLYTILKLSIPLPILVFAVLPNIVLVAGIAWAYWSERRKTEQIQS